MVVLILRPCLYTLGKISQFLLPLLDGGYGIQISCRLDICSYYSSIHRRLFSPFWFNNLVPAIPSLPALPATSISG